MVKVRFVCLANSRKHGGRCVAGVRIDDGQWIRPVSARSDGTLYRQDYAFDSGEEPKPLDVVEIEIGGPRPKPHQPENWELAPGRWRLVERLSPKEAGGALARSILDRPPLLGGPGDRIPFESLRASPAAASLALIEPQTVNWFVTESLAGHRQYRCMFTLGGAHYDLSVTDMIFQPRLQALPMGLHARGAPGIPDDARLLLTVSLGEPWDVDGCCYKLAAGVVVLPS